MYYTVGCHTGVVISGSMALSLPGGGVSGLLIGRLTWDVVEMQRHLKKTLHYLGTPSRYDFSLTKVYTRIAKVQI